MNNLNNMKPFGTPQQVAVYLVAAMCHCPPSSSNSKSHLLSALNNQKSVLETEIRILQEKSATLPTRNQLVDEVEYLEQIIYMFDNENLEAHKVGRVNVENVAGRLIKIENLESGRALNQQVIEKEYLREMEMNRQLNLEIEEVILKIKLLHQSNNVIVRNFGH